MNKIISICISIGFILSFIGYFLCTKHILKVPFAFIPAFILSSITVLIYFGGIFNVLYPIACMLYVGGIIALIWWFKCCYKKINISIKSFHLLDLCFLLGSLPFILLLTQEHLQHYDNFTHWAIIVKVLLTTNAFPTTANHLIEFSNYPIGTSSLIYYFARFLGHSDGVLLIAQGLLIFSLFYAIFGVLEKPKCFLLVTLLGAGLSTLSFFNLTIRINNLLVDFILPILTLACWAIIFRYKDKPKQELILLLPLLALLLIVKTTGILYFAFVICTWIIETRKSNWKFKDIVKAICTCVVSLTTYAAWRYRMMTVLADANNKFSISNSAIENTSAIKTSTDINSIINTFIHTSLDITTRPFLGFILGNIIVISIYLFIKLVKHQRWKKILHSLFLLDFMVIAYYLGILALYVYSMPLDEALTLAGFERYASSIIVLFIGGLVIQVSLRIEEYLKYNEDGTIKFKNPIEKQNYQKAVLISIAVMILILTSEYNGIISTDSSYNTSLPNTIKTVVGDHWISNGKEDENKYLLYGSDANGQMTSYYFQYLARYYLYAPNVDAVCIFYEPNLDNLLSNYDYLVIVESDTDEQKLLKKHYRIEGETGFYQIIKTGNKIVLKKSDSI